MYPTVFDSIIKNYSAEGLVHKLEPKKIAAIQTVQHGRTCGNKGKTEGAALHTWGWGLGLSKFLISASKIGGILAINGWDRFPVTARNTHGL